MTGRSRTERILDVYLAPESDRLPDRVVEAALADIARTPQRRALGVPWRFSLMTNTMRAAAAIAIVAIVGVGVLAFNLRSPGAGSSSPAPSPTVAPTTAATATPAPAPLASGITGWKTYRSAVYGITFGYPDSWSVYGAATRAWRSGDAPTSDVYKDVFVNSEAADGDEIGLWVWQMAPGSGADVTTRAGLAAWAEANACDDATEACETVPDVAVPMCVGRVACGPAVLVPLSDGTGAILGANIGPTDGLVTIVWLGRTDSFPGAARYGGTVQLLKSILTTMDVWTPEPGQIPAGN